MKTEKIPTTLEEHVLKELYDTQQELSSTKKALESEKKVTEDFAEDFNDLISLLKIILDIKEQGDGSEEKAEDGTIIYHLRAFTQYAWDILRNPKLLKYYKTVLKYVPVKKLTDEKEEEE